MSGTILALGGGGFHSDAPTPNLDRYFLSLTSRPKPKICLILTATGDSLIRVASFYKACEAYDCDPTVLQLYREQPMDIAEFVMAQDAVFVSGGNTHNMLLLWRDWGLDAALKKAYDAGKLMGGVSAGANCWFEQCSTDSFPGRLSVIPCLGWLSGSFCPHYDEEEERRPALEKFLKSGEIKPGWAADGKVGILFRGGEPAEAVSESLAGRACRYSYEDGIQEDWLPVRRLGT